MKSKLLFVTPKDPEAGSLVVSLGFMEFLKSRYKKVAFFKPLIMDDVHKDSDITLMLSYFNLDQSYENCYGITLKKAQKLLASDCEATLYKEIIAKYKKLEKKYDFILCEGMSQNDLGLVFDFDINLEIAKNLSAPVVGVINGYTKLLEQIKEEMQLWELSLKEQGTTLFAFFLNRLSNSEKSKAFFSDIKEDIFFLDELKSLNRPTVLGVMEHLGAEIVYGQDEQLLRTVNGYKIAAMHVEHFLDHLQEGDLIIVPGDRIDIILAVIASNSAKNAPCAAGILLCGGFVPSRKVKILLDGLSHIGLPVIMIADDTIQTAEAAIKTPAMINMKNSRKIAQALGLFHDSVDQNLLASKLVDAKSEVMTPAMFEYLIFEKARAKCSRIVLPESLDERILRAAEIITRQKIAKIILLGNRETVKNHAGMIGVELDGIEIIDPNDQKIRDDFADKLYLLRKHKGIRKEIAKDMISHVNYFATMMVYTGMADGMVSGAIHTTRETITPALQIIGTQKDVSIVSSLFFMCMDTQVLVYADCAIVRDPNPEQLAQIAISSAKSAKAFGIDPVVAMLSYSTGDSGTGEDVQKVRTATKIAKELAPDLPIEGPIQYDAAIDPSVGHLKLPNSKIAGHANVFIFPDLNTGNNTYKAVQRATDAIAIGPILQGLNSPVNDLSRGCSVKDIVSTVAITVCQVE